MSCLEEVEQKFVLQINSVVRKSNLCEFWISCNNNYN